MFEWLKSLKPGDTVVLRDATHVITYEGPKEFVESVKEVNDDEIITEPLSEVGRGWRLLKPWRRFKRSSGYCPGGADMRIYRKAS